MMKNFLLVFLVYLSVASCNGSLNDIDKNIVSATFLEQSESNLILKQKFSSALVKVLGQNEEVRSLIKEEALKQIDFDYDVLYCLIKDKQLKNGVTLEEYLEEYLTSDELKCIHKQLPTLTLFVPTLPENSFSVHSWNTIDELPAVAVKVSDNNDVKIYYGNGETEVFPADIIPGFPVVVVKENERIVRNGEILSKTVSENIEETNLIFVDEIFNNLHGKDLVNTKTRANRPDRPVPLPKVDNPEDYLPANMKKTYEAYKIYKNTTGWQRDYIYYGITPTTDKGPFDYNMKEFLVGFELMGDALGFYRKIADQDGDPKSSIPIGGALPANSSIITWTEGEYEFKVTTYVGSKSTIGTESKSFFRLKPDQLFSAEVEKVISRPGMPGYTVYKLVGLKSKRVDLDLPLFEWDLENYGATIKIAIEEVDGQETEMGSINSSIEFATNFGFDTSFGEKVKFGVKFGSTMKKVLNVSNTITKTLGGDELGDVVINFADPVVISDEFRYHYKPRTNPRDQAVVDYTEPTFNSKYYTGWYRLYISPKKTNL
ncbi:MAG: hypothetical protein ACLTSL_16170 [Odoribacter splanchnicus]